MEGFYRQKEGENEKLKAWLISGKVTFPRGKAEGFIRKVFIGSGSGWSKERKERITCVNVKSLTGSHLLALARLRTSLIPLGENFPLPVLPTLQEGRPEVFTELWSRQVALLFQVYRAFHCDLGHISLASCLSSHLLSLHRD